MVFINVIFNSFGFSFYFSSLQELVQYNVEVEDVYKYIFCCDYYRVLKFCVVFLYLLMFIIYGL